MISYSHVDFVFRSNRYEDLNEIKQIPSFIKLRIRELSGALSDNRDLEKFSAMINLGPFRNEDSSFLSLIVKDYLSNGHNLKMARIKCKKELHFKNYFFDTFQMVKIEREIIELLSSSGFEFIIDAEKSQLHDENHFREYLG